MEDIKSFLHQWCAKNGKELQFDVRSTGSKHRRFLCELRVSGFDYVGAGNSTNKNRAQRNAAKDYVNYLVRTNRVSPNDVPRDSATLPGAMETDNSYQPESQDVDVNSGIHGNWTIENAKFKLHQFMQTNKISADYKYTLVGPKHTRRFMAEMSIYVKQLGRNITGRENGSNKQTASKSCALSIVRQLYHLGVIETFGGTLKKNKDVEQMKPYLVKISPELENQIQDVLVDLNIKPIDVKQFPAIREEGSTSNTQGVSLLTNQVLDDFISSVPQPAGIVSWSPPQPNLNPWTGCNIDKGPLASMSLDQLSEYLMKEQHEKLKQNTRLQAIIKKRRHNMPVFAKRNEIMNAVKENPVVIIHGNTGCGKTTQVCQIILDDYIASGQGAYCSVIVTQPRRISVESVADRVATERRETLGQSIGYSVRFESCLPRPYASVMFCTVGVLLRKLKKDGLRGVSHVIVDEIQERDVDSDFIMVVLRDMIHVYPDLRIILMSATIDTTLFSEYFNNSPVIKISDGALSVKQYFLEDCIKLTRFVPPRVSRKRKFRVSDNLSTANEEPEENLNKVIGNEYSVKVKNAMAQLTEKHISFELIDEILIYITKRCMPGNVLIFLPNWNLISALMRHFQQHHVFRGSSYLIIPLHSHSSREDQRKIFDPVPLSIMKIILSTNIAETLITINVDYVINSCKTQVKLLTSHNNTIYAIMWASKMSLEQRKRTTGRIRPGLCFHLCSKARFQKMDEHITPGMLRTPLQELALSIKWLRLGNIRQFLSKTIEPPPIDAVIEAEVVLRELKCLDKNNELTPLGEIMGRLSIEPRLGYMIILACKFRMGDALSTMVANSMTVQDVYNIGTSNMRRISAQQKWFAGARCCDNSATLHAFQAWDCNQRADGELSPSLTYKNLNEQALRIALDVKNHLQALLLQSIGFPKETLCPIPLNYAAVADTHLDTITALLCMGLYPNVCVHKEKREVLTKESKTALIHKTSVNCTPFEQNFLFPFFVFREKIRTREAVSCKQMTMVSPIHLLLFASRKVEYVDGVIRLDNWINLDMNPQHAAAIVALRPALESFVVRASKDPKTILKLSPTEKKVLSLIKSLCSMNACRHELEQITGGNFQSFHSPDLRELTGFYRSRAKMRRIQRRLQQ